MGITLGVGMFVDNSIVVLESSYRKQLAGLSPEDAAREGAAEVGKPIIASTLTTVAVFVPMLFVEGMAGLIFDDLSMTISFALLVSLAVAEGDAVSAGQELAVIEAMKMENILTASQDVVVKELLAHKGESLSVDQPILAFE